MNRAAPPLVGPRNPFCPPPLDAALGGQVSPEFQWQAARMPPLSRSLLLFGDDPGSVDPAELVNELQLDLSTAEDVRRALGARGDEAVLRSPAVLPPAACEALRNAVSAESQQKADTVDGAPDHQLNLSREELESAIGPEAAAALWSLPASYLGEAADTALTSDVEIFVRRYTPATRPWNPFHTDSSRLTINVALDPPGRYTGGTLLGCFDAQVRPLPRGEGDATTHESTLLHGVSTAET